jgi:hypothetical protein
MLPETLNLKNVPVNGPSILPVVPTLVEVRGLALAYCPIGVKSEILKLECLRNPAPAECFNLNLAPENAATDPFPK